MAGVGDQGTTLTHDTLLTRPKLSALGNPLINESQLTLNSRLLLLLRPSSYKLSYKIKSYITATKSNPYLILVLLLLFSTQ